MIVHRKNKYYLYSRHTHKRLGTFPTLKAAKTREKQINFFKYKDTKMQKEFLRRGG